MPSTDITTSPIWRPAASAADPDSVAVTFLPVPLTTSPIRMPTPAMHLSLAYVSLRCLVCDAEAECRRRHRTASKYTLITD